MSENLDLISRLIVSLGDEIESQVYAKGEFVIREGEVERNFYVIESGAVRVFYLTEHEEQVVRFGYQGSVIASLSSFFNESPSEFYIDAIRKTKLLVVPKSYLLEYVSQCATNLHDYNRLLEVLITQQIDREIDLLISSPTERLKRVLRRSPHLFQQIPLKYIASYLRMTPETLSRIRNS